MLWIMTARKLELLVLLIPLAGLMFIVFERAGAWDRMLGLDRVEAAAKQFDLSYAPGASAPVKVGDPEWAPAVELIRKYSHAQLSADRNPLVFARFAAVASGQLPGADSSIPLAE
jgi:hypothetical protein